MARTWYAGNTTNTSHRGEGATRVSLGEEHAPAIPAALSVLPEKRALFAVDTYFRESWEDLQELGSSSVERLLHQHAALLLKPEAVVARRLDAAVGWLSEQGATIAVAEHVRISPHQARAMWQYQWNVATRERRDLCDLIAQAGESLFLVVRMPEDELPATVRLSERKGPADPSRRQPWQLRHRLGGQNYLLNHLHTADEPADLVRELGVLFDAVHRRHLYDAMLHGQDRGEQVHHRIAELYRATIPHSLSFSDVIQRLTDRVDRNSGSEATDELLAALTAAEEGFPVRWRELCDLAARAGIQVAPWDRIVLGTHLMVASQSGTPILSTVSTDQWRRRAYGADPFDTVGASPELQFGRTVPHETVHKTGISEVLVTDSAQVSADDFVVAGELPTAHCYYNDTPGSAVSFDLMPMLEMCRQAGYAVVHEHLDIPRDQNFIIRRYRMGVAPANVFAEQPVPLRVVVHCRVEQLRARPGKAPEIDLGFAVSTPDGDPLATASMAACWVGPSEWEHFRRDSRARQQLPDEIRPVARHTTLLPARSVGRDSERNVVLANMNVHDGQFSAEVVVNPDNRGMFEHEQDHVPGMVQLEAARQASIRAVADTCQITSESITVSAIDATFSTMAELDLPLRIAGTAVTTGYAQSIGTVTAEILQNGVRIFRASVDVAGPDGSPSEHTDRVARLRTDSRTSPGAGRGRHATRTSVEAVGPHD